MQSILTAALSKRLCRWQSKHGAAPTHTNAPQVPKARNQLKRVSKLPYSPADADEFERAWLALADIHVQGGKFDLAQASV